MRSVTSRQAARVKLSDLEPQPSFALLGPGFGHGRFLLLTQLRPAAIRHATATDAALVFAPFETNGVDALTLEAAEILPCEVELAPIAAEPRVVLDRDAHEANVTQIRTAIARGDVYQVCLTVRAHVSPMTGAELLARMCRGGLPRFAAWVRLPDGTEFVSASPELFFETDRDHVHAEPMKGTARPGLDRQLDGSEKDRAELAMITDLLRNDLTQVCRPRTVRVANERRVLTLPYAVQTVSDVVGVLRDHVSALDVLAALHPGGSVTGAPKHAALGMIRALERGPRGAYCGALGLLMGTRSVFSLLIRTATRAPAGWTYGVGGGIVYDSDPGTELAELETKLGALGGRAPAEGKGGVTPSCGRQPRRCPVRRGSRR